MCQGKEQGQQGALPRIPSNDEYDSDPQVQRWHCGWAMQVARMLCGANNMALLQLHSTQTWDLIVVGAGVAGSALAYKQAGVSDCGRNTPATAHADAHWAVGCCIAVPFTYGHAITTNWAVGCCIAAPFTYGHAITTNVAALKYCCMGSHPACFWCPDACA